MVVEINNVKRIEPGFGPIFWNTRIHLQHLIFEMRTNMSDDEILQRYSTLKPEHIRLFRQYYIDNTDEVLDMDRELTLQTELRMREFNERFPQPEETRTQKLERMSKTIRDRKAAEYEHNAITG